MNAPGRMPAKEYKFTVENIAAQHVIANWAEHIYQIDGREKGMRQRNLRVATSRAL